MSIRDVLLIGVVGGIGFAVYEYFQSQNASSVSPGVAPPGGGSGQPGTNPSPSPSPAGPPSQVPYNYPSGYSPQYDPGYYGTNMPTVPGYPQNWYPPAPPSHYNATQNTLGIRYNNPGNLRPGGHEAHYPSMRVGIEAAMDNVLAYWHLHGLNTIAGIIGRWAPPNENDTQAYINFVASRMGTGANQAITVTNALTMYNLLSAIFAYETANQFNDYSTLQSVVGAKLGNTFALPA